MIRPSLCHFEAFGLAVVLACEAVRAREAAEATEGHLVRGVDLFLACGRGARCGFPLPSGHLPVLAGDAVRLMEPVEWEAYLDLCAGPVAVGR